MGNCCHTCAYGCYGSSADCSNFIVIRRPRFRIILTRSIIILPAVTVACCSCQCTCLSNIYFIGTTLLINPHLHCITAVHCKEHKIIRYSRFFLGGFFCGLLAAGLLGCRLRLYLRLFRLILRGLLLGARLRLRRSLRFLYRLLLYLRLYLTGSASDAGSAASRAGCCSGSA